MLNQLNTALNLSIEGGDNSGAVDLLTTGRQKRGKKKARVLCAHQTERCKRSEAERTQTRDAWLGAAKQLEGERCDRSRETVLMGR